MTIVKNRFVVLCLLSVLFVFARSSGIYDLKYVMLTNPLEIYNTNPHLSWKIGEVENNYIQGFVSDNGFFEQEIV